MECQFDDHPRGKSCPCPARHPPTGPSVVRATPSRAHESVHARSGRLKGSTGHACNRSSHHENPILPHTVYRAHPVRITTSAYTETRAHKPICVRLIAETFTIPSTGVMAVGRSLVACSCGE